MRELWFILGFLVVFTGGLWSAAVENDALDLSRQVEIHDCDGGQILVEVDRYTTKWDLELACLTR